MDAVLHSILLPAYSLAAVVHLCPGVRTIRFLSTTARVTLTRPETVTTLRCAPYLINTEVERNTITRLISPMRFPPRLSLKTSKNSTVAPPGQNGSVPKIFLRHLINIEPNAQFEFYQPDLIKSPGAIYYAKTSTIPKPMKLRRAEAELIKFLDQVAPGLAPDLIASGSIKNLIDTGLGCETYRSYFLYKWEELRPLSSSSAETLARRLANDVHSHIGPNGFGIYNPNSDPTEGVSYTSWEECFSTLMAGTLFRLETLGYPRLCYKGNKIKKRHVLNPNF